MGKNGKGKGPLVDFETDLEDTDAEKARTRRDNDIYPISGAYTTNGYLVKHAIETVHAFYRELVAEKVTGIMDRSPRTNRRLMKVLRRMADGAAEALNIGIAERSEHEEDLQRYPTNEKSALRRSMERTEKMVEDMHAKSGLSSKKRKSKVEQEIKKQKKAEEEMAAKKRAKSWAQKLAKNVTPQQSRPPSPTIEEVEDEEVTKRKEPRKKTLSIIQSLPNPTPQKAAEGKTPGMRWIEKEITRLYDGRVVKVIDIIQERDGERKIVMEVPEAIKTEDFERDVPKVFLRMFNDVKEIFWDKPTWKLVVHRVPFEGRETPAALRSKIMEENGVLDMPPRIIQRIINKGLRQKETPIIIEIGKREEAIKLAREGLVVNGERRTAEPYRPKKNEPSPSTNKPNGGKTCHNCGAKGHFIAECKKERVETRKCNKCSKVGHLAANCKSGTDRKERRKTDTKGQTHSHNSPPPTMKFPCHKCKKTGHRRKDCPMRTPEKPQDKPNRRREGGTTGGRKEHRETENEILVRSDWDETRKNHARRGNREDGSRADGWSAGEEHKNLW